jgi:hypothetical protein
MAFLRSTLLLKKIYALCPSLFCTKLFKIFAQLGMDALYALCLATNFYAHPPWTCIQTGTHKCQHIIDAAARNFLKTKNNILQ